MLLKNKKKLIDTVRLKEKKEKRTKHFTCSSIVPGASFVM
tara:strand:- start:37 stop:156 length:120 start_codon:yes stop_codon:yes gene_type:complete